MGTRNTPEQQREYNRAYRARARDAGYRHRRVLVHDNDWTKVKRLAETLTKQRRGE